MSFTNDLRHGMGYEGAGAASGIGPSDIIWNQFRRDFGTKLVRGVEFDFTEGGSFTTAGSNFGINTYQDTGVTLNGSATLDNGLEVAGNDADNDEGVIGGVGNIATISDTASESRLLAFEACVSKASIADNGLAFFVGLCESGVVGANALADNTGAVADKDLIGFHCDQADGDAIDAIYQKSGQTAQVVKAGAQVPVADTFYKLGFVYDPAAANDRKVTFYIDGTDIGSYVTATNIAAATFPDSEDLTWIFATKVGAAAEVIAHLRWVRVAQYR